MIRINQIKMPISHTEEELWEKSAKLLKIKKTQIRSMEIVKKSIDARKKPELYFVYSVNVVTEKDEAVLKKVRDKNIMSIQKKKYQPKVTGELSLKSRPVIVGAGPAGLFCTYLLAKNGYEPILLERGKAVEDRQADVEKFWKTGVLDTSSNVQFGEGGAGTFSDGKLNTGVNNPRIGWILEQFVKCGARENILYDAKPHVGTDVLLTVVQNLRGWIISLGGEVRFHAHVTGICTENGRVTGLVLENGEQIQCDHTIFAIGHSARDTFEMLDAEKIPMEPKPFAMGVRIEHKQTAIDAAQYGRVDPVLPPADYKLVKHLEDGTVYTFCMCPGGFVVAAASEEGGVVTNGMSYADRDGENANAALLVTVNPEEFPYEGNLGGVCWQREIEQAAYRVSGSYRAPAQTVGDFLSGRPGEGAGSVLPTYRPGVHWCDLHAVLPEKISRCLKEALPLLDGNLPGFAAADAVLTAPETRSSSPVRIVRGEDRQSELKGFYPCGEGAGYAGGIMSAAVDGIMSAEAVIKAIKENL